MKYTVKNIVIKISEYLIRTDPSASVANSHPLGASTQASAYQFPSNPTTNVLLENTSHLLDRLLEKLETSLDDPKMKSKIQAWAKREIDELETQGERQPPNEIEKHLIRIIDALNKNDVNTDFLRTVTDRLSAAK